MQLKSLKRLKTLMEIHELSARDLAEIAGYKSHTSVVRVLRGESKNFGNDQSLRLAAYFKIPVDDLFVVRVSNGVEDSERSNAA